MQDHTIKKQTKNRKHGRNRHESTTAADTQRMSDAVALPFTHLTRKRVLANRCRIIIPHSVVACDAKKKKKSPRSAHGRTDQEEVVCPSRLRNIVGTRICSHLQL
jgi:hypothetical protein